MAYTWDNRQADNANVKARLERAFSNEAFRQKYEHILVWHVSEVEYGHCFVVTEINEKLHSQGVRRAKQCTYENVWQTHTVYEKLVTYSLQRQNYAPDLQGIMESLGALQQELEPWGMCEFGCLARTIRQL